LGADVALPFVLGGEGGDAAVGGEGAWEGAAFIVELDVFLCDV
jgi:hypothetical protein